MIKKIILTVIVFFIFSNADLKNSVSILYASVSSEISDTTYDCTVVMNSRSTYKDVNLFGLKDSSVMILQDEISRKLFIGNIRTIKFKARGFWKGAAIGGGIGFGIGAIAGAGGVNLGSDGSNKGSIGESLGIGLILGVPFGLLGGGLGALFAEDQFYNLSNMDFETKRIKIRYLIKKYSDK